MKKLLVLLAFVSATPALAMGSAPVEPPAAPVVVPEPKPVVTPPAPAVTPKPATTTTAKKTTTQKKTTAKKPPPTSNVRPEVKAPTKVTRKAVLSKSKQPAK